mgnify:CR=1 FL=1
MKVYENTSEAYVGSLRDVLENPDFISSPRDQKIREKLDYSFRVMSPTPNPIVTMDEKRNSVIASYTMKEVELYNSCSNKAEDFGKASKFWLQLANPDGTVNSAYGHLIWAKKSHGSDFEIRQEESKAFLNTDGLGKVYNSVPVRRTPWEWCIQSLKQDRDTRQAILRFSLPEHQWVGNRDQTCTMHGNFLIRDDKLHLSVVMRSNDLVKGLVYDMPWFCSLMDKMIEELREHYPTLTKGNYTHTVHSFHIYERDLEIVKKMLNG